jgi:hypothetical protein
MKKINILIITFFLIASCGSVKDAGKVLRNEKVKNSDEFLVKKKDPLELPPNFDEIPEPGVSIKQENKKEKINKILKIPKNTETKKDTSALEEVILKSIRK